MAEPTTTPPEAVDSARWSVVCSVGKATEFEALSPSQHEVAQSIAEKHHDLWPTSATYRSAVERAEEGATQGIDGGRLRIRIGDHFDKQGGRVRWTKEGTLLEIHSNSRTHVPGEDAVGGLTQPERLLIFEMMNAASKEDFGRLTAQVRDGSFEKEAQAGKSLSPEAQTLVEKEADVPAMLYAIEVEKIEHRNAQRCWTVIQELGSPTIDSGPARNAKRLAELPFDDYFKEQVGLGHTARIRDRYHDERRKSAADTAGPAQ